MTDIRDKKVVDTKVVDTKAVREEVEEASKVVRAIGHQRLWQ